MYKRTPLEKSLRTKGPGKVWYVRGYDYTGRRYEVSTHQTDRKAAIEAARKIARDKSVPPPDQAENAAAGSVTLTEVLEMLRAHDKRVDAAPKTVKFHIERGRHLVRLLGKHRLVSEITLAVMQEYSDTRLAEGADRHTIQKEHRVLRQSLGIAKQAGKYAGEPKVLTVEGFDKAKGLRGYYKPGARWLEKPEYVDALVMHTSANTDKYRVDRRDDIIVYVNLGIRRREILRIHPEHVNLIKREVFVAGTKTDSSPRLLPLNDVLCELFTRRMKLVAAGTPLWTDWGSGNRDLRANWARARAWLISKEESVPRKEMLMATLPVGLTFNDLRRTFCSLMKAAGVPEDTCADLLGHKDVEMVRAVYGRTSMDNLHRAVAQLPAIALPDQRPETVRATRRKKQHRDGQAKGRSVRDLGLATVRGTNPMSETERKDVG